MGATAITAIGLEYEDDYEYEFVSSEHAHFEHFRPPNLKRVLSTEYSYS